MRHSIFAMLLMAGAEPGQHCDRRTLGRHPTHKARVDALAAAKQE